MTTTTKGNENKKEINQKNDTEDIMNHQALKKTIVTLPHKEMVNLKTSLV
jgi:hypothetical protein